ncbi:MAG: hypothetical protein V7765_08835 [Oleispira sp.]
MTVDVHSLTLKYKDGGLQKGITDLDKYAMAGVQAGKSTSVFTDKVGLMNTTIKQTGTVVLPKASSSFNRFSSSLKPAKNAAQLVAFQVQDLAVQLSMGTSAMIAFGQQAPQLASAFGPGGAVIGAIVGVGFAIAGPLIAAFSSGETAAGDFQMSIDGVRDSLKSTRLEVNQGAVDLLKKQIRESTEAIDKLNKSTENARKARLRLNVKNRKIAENNAEIEKIEKIRIRNAEVLAELYEQQNKIQEEGIERLGGKASKSLDPEGDRLAHLFELNKMDVADKKRTEAEKTRITTAAVRHREAVERSTISAATSTMANLVEIAKAGGEESFQTYKRLAQTQAAMSAALGVMSVIADPLIPTAFKPIAIAATAGLAAVQIAQIDAQQYSARENGGQVMSGSKVLVGERGPEVLEIGAQGGFITPNSRLGGGENVTVVNQIGNGVSGNVRAEITSALPAIIAATTKAVRSGRR